MAFIQKEASTSIATTKLLRLKHFPQKCEFSHMQFCTLKWAYGCRDVHLIHIYTPIYPSLPTMHLREPLLPFCPYSMWGEGSLCLHPATPILVLFAQCASMQNLLCHTFHFYAECLTLDWDSMQIPNYRFNSIISWLVLLS